jgi:hypothetical protein
MLYEFLKSNRPELITRCRAKVAKRSGPPPTRTELDHGIPLFLDQLTEMLPGGRNAGSDPKPTPGSARSPAEIRIKDGATMHGAELLRHDFTIEQVVHDYGDLCQSITELAVEQNALIEAHEFGILNIRLDNAIASAVTSYARKATAQEVSTAAADNLSQIAHEMRNLHTTITIAIAALNRGAVGFGGATSAALDKSMARMGKLLDRVVALAH